MKKGETKYNKLKKSIIKDYYIDKNLKKIAVKYNLSHSTLWRYIQLWVNGINQNKIQVAKAKEIKVEYSAFCRNCADFKECKSNGWAVCPYAGMTYHVPTVIFRMKRVVGV